MPVPTLTHETCDGSNNGIIKMVPSGGNGKYEYLVCS